MLAPTFQSAPARTARPQPARRQPGRNQNGQVKLGSGELRAMIEHVLASQPDRQWQPREIYAHPDLKGRSSAAINNALATLVRKGRATLTGGAYQHTGSGQMPPVTAAPPPTFSAGPVLRPSGTPYFPRDLAGRRDVDVLRQLRAAGIAALLYGPPGTGKTSLVEAAFGTELFTVAGDGDTTVGDLLGEYAPDGAGGYVWLDGPLVRAMLTGAVFFLDDCTLVSPRVLAAVYPAMDGRGEIVLKANGGRIVKAEPGFYTVGGHNPNVHGAVLSDALASRFSLQLQVTTDYDLAARQLHVPAGIVKAARDLWEQVVREEIGWAPQLRELLGAKAIAAELGLDVAVANLIGTAPEEDRDAVRAALKKHLPGVKQTTLTLGKQL
ncbi:AAA family ATPase [Longispora albida]|uniref:AAA family ATPase n=1 Tax=Longispora albida TaxID=203523 RepID=UPI000372908E|nr:AAA family ATPase [Longispora albida]